MPSRGPFPAGLRLAIVARSVSPLHGAGGLERHVGDLVRHLADRDVDVTLITRGADHPGGLAALSGPRITICQVPYVSFPLAGRRGTTVLDRSTAYPLFGYRAGRLAARLADEGRIDLVYGHGASALGYAMAHNRGPQTTPPLVFNPHGLEEFGGIDGAYGGRTAKRIGYAPLRSAVRYCARSADRVIATDRVLWPAIGAHLGVADEVIRLVPNAVDLRRADGLAGPRDGSQMRDRHGIGRDDVVLLSVGRLEHNKGFHVMADALASIADVPWRWVLVGEGSSRPVIERRLRRAGLLDRTTLVGTQDDAALHAWYEAATLFVHPTLYEGSSIVTLEAMAHRRAVVASLAGGLPDKVRDGQTGWLVAPGDAGALALALRRALTERIRLREMGLAGRALVEAEFSWTAATQSLVAVFAELLSEVRPS
ncbi:MAG: glycosyltransferase family 4 protein [Acidobacteriota bacterium]